MHFVRQIIADRFSGGVLALVLSFLMMLDGAIGAHALGSMAAAEQVAASQIICSTDAVGHAGHGDEGAKPVHHKHGGSVDHSECCSAACQFAAQVAATDLPAILTQQWPLLQSDETVAWHAVPVASQPAGIFKDARGPPVFSI